jgi:hypothetical protein
MQDRAPGQTRINLLDAAIGECPTFPWLSPTRRHIPAQRLIAVTLAGSLYHPASLH